MCSEWSAEEKRSLNAYDGAGKAWVKRIAAQCWPEAADEARTGEAPAIVGGGSQDADAPHR